MRSFFLLILLAFTNLFATAPSPNKIRATYNSLDVLSIVQHLAFYELYPNTCEGQMALEHAWKLMHNETSYLSSETFFFLDQSVEGIIALVQRQPNHKTSVVNEEALKAIEKASCNLGNRKLKGHNVETEAEVLALQPNEIDLAHAIFLSQNDKPFEKRHYEAAIDLMALQIRARLSVQATPEQKIRTINDFIFFELGFRFPPSSLYVKAVDRYTSLSSVIDSRKGICLGVSILYLALAQRLDLNLEIVTPPGHIFVRYREGDRIINIETTARGIDLDSEEYLSVETLALQERNIKETVGLVHFNQAADELREGHFSKALEAYEKAKLYMQEDALLEELMGTCHLIEGNLEEGRSLLKKSSEAPLTHIISQSPIYEDYLQGNVDAKTLKCLFLHADEQHESIVKKQKSLEKAVKRFPRFRAGILALAMTWIQLQRFGEALELFEKYHALDPQNPKIEYYLAVIYAERFNYPKAWKHLKAAEQLTSDRQHYPKVLKELRHHLSLQSPE